MEKYTLDMLEALSGISGFSREAEVIVTRLDNNYQLVKLQAVWV